MRKVDRDDAIDADAVCRRPACGRPIRRWIAPAGLTTKGGPNAFGDVKRRIAAAANHGCNRVTGAGVDDGDLKCVPDHRFLSTRVRSLLGCRIKDEAVVGDLNGWRIGRGGQRVPVLGLKAGLLDQPVTDENRHRRSSPGPVRIDGSDCDPMGSRVVVDVRGRHVRTGHKAGLAIAPVDPPLVRLGVTVEVIGQRQFVRLAGEDA